MIIKLFEEMGVPMLGLYDEDIVLAMLPVKDPILLIEAYEHLDNYAHFLEFKSMQTDFDLETVDKKAIKEMYISLVKSINYEQES